jgi:hypothetical protein
MVFLRAWDYRSTIVGDRERRPAGNKAKNKHRVATVRLEIKRLALPAAEEAQRQA